jgi:ELWxxDGT repeat protein
MLKDINPGAATSDVRGFCAVGGKLIFQATNAANGAEIWETDGTAAGTVLLQDIATGWPGSLPLNFTLVNTILYFSATTETYGTEMYYGVVATALPLSLLDFSARQQGQDGLLKWRTTNEINSAFFDIERSTDAQHFRKIGQVNAAGGVSVNGYSYTDTAITLMQSPVLYYRLRLVDTDGRYTSSPVQSITLQEARAATLFPNPAKSFTTLRVEVPRRQVIHYQVLDAGGRVLQNAQATLAAGSNNITIHTSALVPGLYLLKINEGHSFPAINFIKE